MSSVTALNADADVIGKNQAFFLNAMAAKSMSNILKSNLGPKGTLKMLVSGAGDLTLTKDGNVLLRQMQIQHPTASLIARTATAQDDVTGDGTTSNVLFTGELMKQAESYIVEGLHPRALVEGMEMARDECLKFLEGYKTPFNAEGEQGSLDRAMLLTTARTALRTKLDGALADSIADIVTDAVLCIRSGPGASIDLHMVEIMQMQHQSLAETRLVRGLVLDHGARHPGMSRFSKDCFILTCNVSLEYEKSEVNSGFFYSNADERERLVAAEREFTNAKVKQVVALKNEVCTGEKKDWGFVVVNQKGIDPVSLDILQRNGIVGIRRAKRRNMERLTLACGGYAVNSLHDLSPDCLGYAGEVYEQTLGEDKFTFIDHVRNPRSCTILVKGPHKHELTQIKDAIRDGLRAIKNIIEDKATVPGAAAFELAAHVHLSRWAENVQGRKQLGVKAFADALLVIPKVLAQNSGLDVQDCLLSLLEEARKGHVVGIDVVTGKPIEPVQAGIIDCYRVKRQFIHLGSLTACKLLLVDEVLRAGKRQGGGGPGPAGPPGGMMPPGMMG